MRNLMPDGREAASALEDTILEDLLRDSFLPKMQKLSSPRKSPSFLFEEDAAALLSNEFSNYKAVHASLFNIWEEIDWYHKQGHAFDKESPLQTAGRIPEHDLISLFNAPLGYLDMLVSDLADGTPITDEVIQNTVRTGHLLIPYFNVIGTLVSGDKDAFHYQMDAKEVDDFISNIEKPEQCNVEKGYSIPVTNGLKGTIDSRYLVPIAQMVKNAYKYGKNPQVNVQEGDMAYTIIIQDSGNGMDLPMDRIPEIFEDYTTSGTGLGLHLSKKIIGQVGGVIEVRARDAQGKRIAYSTNWSEAFEDKIPMNDKTTFMISIPKTFGQRPQ